MRRNRDDDERDLHGRHAAARAGLRDEGEQRRRRDHGHGAEAVAAEAERRDQIGAEKRRELAEILEQLGGRARRVVLGDVAQLDGQALGAAQARQQPGDRAKRGERGDERRQGRGLERGGRPRDAAAIRHGRAPGSPDG
jgi:hypothetical protein